MTGADVPAAITPAMRDGVLHAIARLDRLAAAADAMAPTDDDAAVRAYAYAAAALREELKIAEDNAEHGRTA